jgi:hypothetical protein
VLPPIITTRHESNIKADVVVIFEVILKHYLVKVTKCFIQASSLISWYWVLTKKSYYGKYVVLETGGMPIPDRLKIIGSHI